MVRRPPPPDGAGGTGGVGRDGQRSRLRCGVFVLAGRYPGQDDGTALRRALDTVVAAEAAGFHDAWIAEHHFMSYGVCPSAVTFAAHALGRTSRIAIGTAVSVLSTTHPVALAEQTALLDQLSNGRFHLAVGRGGPWVDLEVFGTGLDRYERDFSESLDLLLRCVSDKSVAAEGPAFRFREVPMVPRPRTLPRPPVTVACTSPATVELAAQRGLPMLLGLHMDDDGKADLVAHYAKARAKYQRHERDRTHGAPPGDRGMSDCSGQEPPGAEERGGLDGGDQRADDPPHIAAVVAQVADDEREARRLLQTTMPGWLAEGLAGYVPVDGRPRPQRDPHDYTDLLCRIHPVGSPDDCIDRLRRTVEATGIRHLIMLVEGTGDHARTLENVARLGAEVIPML